ncbi:DUF1156 domain-containing protein [Agromyces intestinalis]|uniref:DUF1156 domain-containing protein n=1 Tax=Agromyces intestinalis TaxID=2592652 RepID=UPI00143D1C02|nr:DUF1156 domain-containing protein [Agromyces intestinalis]
MTETARKKKLIEVALPLEEINAACKSDKDRKTGTLRNLHKWFAPMPLPAWRALLFAALIDDPEDDNQRVYLLDLIKRLVRNGADLPDAADMREAQTLLKRQFPDGLPAVLDPFCGGGSTLVEAQRFGLESKGSDLNPVPVLITRAITDLLPRVYGAEPLSVSNSAAETGDQLFSSRTLVQTSGYDGIAEDVLHFARRVREAVEAEIGTYFPKGNDGKPSTWLWGRTAICPNPACSVESVLTTTWWLSKRKGALAWLEPIASRDKVELTVIRDQASGSAPDSPKIGRGASFSCLACRQTIDEAEIRRQGQSGGLGLRLMAVQVVAPDKSRFFRAPTAADLEAAASARRPEDLPDISLGEPNQYIAPPRYGITSQLDLYTNRQLLVLSTFATKIREAYEWVLEAGGGEERAACIATLLGLALGKLAQGGSTQTRWKFDSRSGSASPEGIFGRADLPMTWDFAEVDPLGEGAKSWTQNVETLLDALPYAPHGQGSAVRSDARTTALPAPGLVATDPPYFDAIGYADLSDFFYLWHRRALRDVHPDLYGTIAAPKAGELTAFPWHHGGSRDQAQKNFISGFVETFHNLRASLREDLPMLVVYASKEQQSVADEQSRWASILTAIIDAELEITGTWPIHGTGSTRMRGQGSNAVATYIAMVCRPRAAAAPNSSVSDFTRALRRELGPAVRDLQAASILPVDLAQAALGPGMQIFSRYRAVLDQAGERISVGRALDLINTALGEVLDEQVGELDPESRFAVRWWETHGWVTAPFAEADKAARPLGISVDDVKRAQVAVSEGTRVRLLGIEGLDRTWAPTGDTRPTAWEAVHHLVDRLVRGGGELESARLMSQLGSLQDPAMALTYRLHEIAASKGRTADQERYNALINSWSELVKLSASHSTAAGRFF